QERGDVLGVETQLFADDVVVDAPLVGEPVDVLDRLAQVVSQLGCGPQLARDEWGGLGSLVHASPYAAECLHRVVFLRPVQPPGAPRNGWSRYIFGTYSSGWVGVGGPKTASDL